MMGFGHGFGPGYGYGGMMGGYGVGGPLMFLFGLLLIVGVVLLVVWATRASHGHGSQSAPRQPLSAAGHDEAVAIAKRRLASGEITTEQYNEILHTLGG